MSNYSLHIHPCDFSVTRVLICIRYSATFILFIYLFLFVLFVCLHVCFYFLITELKVKANLTADSTTIPTGGSVTLTCDLKDPGSLVYEWFREILTKNKYRINVRSVRVISISEGGIYTCRGWRKNTDVVTTESDPITIQETGEFKVSFRIKCSQLCMKVLMVPFFLDRHLKQ